MKVTSNTQKPVVSTLSHLKKKFQDKLVFLHDWPERRMDSDTLKMLKAVNCRTVDYVDKELAYILTTLKMNEVETLVKASSDMAEEKVVNELISQMLQKKENSNNFSIQSLRLKAGLQLLLKAKNLKVQIISVERLWRWIMEKKETEKLNKPVENVIEKPCQLNSDVIRLSVPAVKITYSNNLVIRPLWQENVNYMQHIWLPSNNTPSRLDDTLKNKELSNPLSTNSHSVGKQLQRTVQCPHPIKSGGGGEGKSTRKNRHGNSLKREHYCEFCEVKYTCILDHMQSNLHKSKASQPGLYKLVDQIIQSLPNMADVMESCSENNAVDEHPIGLSRTSSTSSVKRRIVKLLPPPPVFSSQSSPPQLLLAQPSAILKTQNPNNHDDSTTFSSFHHQIQDKENQQHPNPLPIQQSPMDSDNETCLSPEMKCRFRICDECKFMHIPLAAASCNSCCPVKKMQTLQDASVHLDAAAMPQIHFPLRKPSVQFSSPQLHAKKAWLSVAANCNNMSHTEPSSPLTLTPTGNNRFKRRRSIFTTESSPSSPEAETAVNCDTLFADRQPLARRQRLSVLNNSEMQANYNCHSPSGGARAAKLNASSMLFIHQNYS